MSEYKDANMNEFLRRGQNIESRIDELAAISEDTHLITRTFGTPAFLKGSHTIAGWMQKTGLQTHTDNMGNVRGRLSSHNANAKTLVIASHMDSVVNAGRYYGPLGILVGLDIIESLVQSATAIPFNIELVAFSDEEGVRFHTTYLGS